MVGIYSDDDILELIKSFFGNRIPTRLELLFYIGSHYYTCDLPGGFNVDIRDGKVRFGYEYTDYLERPYLSASQICDWYFTLIQEPER